MTTELAAALAFPGISLRELEPHEAPALAELRSASLRELALLEPADAAAFEARARAEFAELFAARLLRAWAIVANGDIAGSACVIAYRRLPYPTTSRHAELAGVYVAPTLRRRGLARELCRAALAGARADGARKIFVSPSHAGRALYRELGFSEAGMLALAGT